jgi:MYXO-CTERM domain-containing protein
MSLKKSPVLFALPVAWLLALTAASSAEAAAPANIRFFDVDSANYGSYVGIYGQGFGVQQGKVSIGSTDAAEYPLWTDTVIIARIPAGAITAPLTVHVSGGAQLTNPLLGELKIHNGNTYVVSVDTGEDTNSGDLSSPFKTIGKALSVVGPGDTVLVREGTYDEEDGNGIPSPAVFIRSSMSGTAAKPITLRGWGSEIPVLRGSAELSRDNPVLYVGGDWVRVARMKIEGTGNQTVTVSAQGNNTRLAGLEVTAFTEQGIFVGEGAGNSLVGNRVHTGGTVQGLSHGIVFTGTGTVIDNEVDHLDNGYGIVLQYQTQQSTLVHGNFIHHTAGAGFGLWRVKGGNRLYNNVVWNTGLDLGCQCALEIAYGAQAGETATVADRIYYNTFAGPGLLGLRLADRAGTLELHGNIFGDFTGGIEVADSASMAALRSSHNLWFNDGPAPLFRWGAGYVDFAMFKTASQQEGSSFIGDPLFMALATGDLHLKPNSPAIDQGGGPDQPNNDYDGVARPLGQEKDWGAFEAPAGDAGPGADASEGGDGEVPDAATGPDGAGQPDAQEGGEADGAAADSGTTPGFTAPGDEGGCGCSTPGTGSPAPAALLMALGAFIAARRKRS